eukprot:5391410-Prymnesium_polylepis.1
MVFFNTQSASTPTRWSGRPYIAFGAVSRRRPPLVAGREKAHFVRCDPSIAVRARKRHNRSRRGSPHHILGRPI